MDVINSQNWVGRGKHWPFQFKDEQLSGGVARSRVKTNKKNSFLISGDIPMELAIKCTADVGVVDEKLGKYFRERPDEGYYLRESCQACVTAKLKTDCGKAPRGSILALFVFFPVLGHCCRNKMGQEGPLGWTCGAACREARQLPSRQFWDICWPEELKDTRAGVNELPQMPGAAVPLAAWRAHPPSAIN